MVLDSGKVSHSLRRDLGPKSFYYEQIFLLLKFNIYNFTFLEKIKKEWISKKRFIPDLALVLSRFKFYNLTSLADC